ncbi:fibronectin type III domain-containing protein [Chitinophaga ginsengisegetis]|uniref:fibronectin type III domain-containing protein n=1 Tax=Chitinophaga ginsengisegetis TaxID=393003 RepID=UPI000DBA4BF4|nr:PA14 domain-containing protein [Chitinophaga ginsengisegetis]MDR6567612.1 putative esterase/P pilus assembly chaperone PapD [Chitinophaga ginsengisegetis]MDR6647833.1 putative esterase/P pilus assembly chaperone PapD [Chitinophaga ginsengisegetis]MDR6654183.1 putative esterase/P pilus assembly chaperone PapD [Chitinophaga ginsengisegetis]
MNRTLHRMLLLMLLGLCYLPAVKAQTALNPSDPVITYNPAAPPADPQYDKITKWVRTVRMSYGTSSYKCYIYKNMAFRLKFPKTYAPGVNDGKKYPIYLFFHGVGEKGTIYDNEYQLLWGGQTWASRVDNGQFDGYLIYPQSQGGYWGPNDYDNLKEVIDSIVTSAKGDPDRLSVNGLSGGGWATWEFTMRYPQLTAASLPMSAMATDYGNHIDTYKFTPMWLFQGGLDGNPAPYTTNQVVALINAAGGNFKLTTYPNDEHNTWVDAWNEPDFAPFMLRANRLNPYPLYGSATFCPGETITVGIAPGFLQYEWQKDGVTISTGTSNSIAVTTPGAYRVRGQLPNGWTGWSPTPLVISYKPASPPQTITTSPALASNVLPAPDGSTGITLQVPAGMLSYEWIRAGSATIISTTNTLTTSTPGAYVVRVKAPNYCIGTYSDTFRVVNSTGVNGPDPISSLVVNSFTKTQIVLSWVENATPAYNEKYFEIYRATQAGGPYVLVGKNNANVVTFTDNNLIPNTSYFYKVRPVNDNAAGPLSAEVKGTTATDSSAPSAPPSLTLGSYTNNQVILNWSAATDDAGIAGYDVYANNVLRTSVGNVLTATVTGLTDGTLYNFYVKAKDVSGKSSTPSNQVTVRTKKANLNYKYYTGSYSNLPNFTNLTPAQTGKAYVPDQSIVPAGVTTNYAVMWTGYIRIPVTGTYKFETYSDDGSKLYFNKAYSNSATATVNNDGAHAAAYASGTVIVNAGVYPITVTYFQGGGGSAMGVYWTSTAAGINTRTLIPAEAFIDTSVVNGTAPTAPTTLAVAVNNYSKLNLTWADKSNNETGFEIYRSTSSGGTYTIVATAAANAVSYTDTALNASTAYYYKIRAIGLYGESAYSAVANATTAAKPLPPAVPTNLVTQALSTQVVKLTWTDNSTIETGYEIQRSLADSLHFSVLKSLGPVASGQGTFSDSSLVANTVVYYKIRAFGEGGYSAFTKAVIAKSLNNPPVIADISSQTIRYGTTQSIPLSATDPDNDAITFSLYNAPAFFSLQQNAGTTSLILAPTAAQQGTYNGVGVIATDANGGKDTALFNIIVNDNYPPVIDSVAGWSADEGTQKTVKVSLHDLNPGNTYTWTALQIPPFATITSNNDTCVINLQPGYGASGTYTIKLQATDNQGGIDVRSFVLTVVDKPTPNYKLLLNFTLNSLAPAPWNNITGATSNLKDDNGQTTSVGLSFDETWWAAGTEGATTGNNSGVYPDAVMSQYLYFGSLPGFFTGAPSMHGHLTGLETNRTYSIKFFSSSKWWAPQPDNGSTQYTINGVTKALNVQNNTANTAVFENLTADANGEIKFTLSIPAGGQVGYLNAMEINAGGAGDTTVVVNQPPVITAIPNKTLTAGDTLHVQLQGSDPENDAITYTGYNLPSFVSVVQSQGSNPYLLVAPATNNAGQFNNIGVIGTDTHGNSDTAVFNLTVNAPAGGDTSGYKLFLNIKQNSTAPAPWNNVTGRVTNNLKNDQGQTTASSLVFDETWWATNGEGAITGNNSGVYPDAVINDFLYFGSLPGFFTGAPSMTGHITGLEAGKKFTVKFFSSSKWWAPQPDNGSTKFTINGVSQTLYVQNNSTSVVSFTNLSPDANGEIVFTLSIPAGGQVGYLNAIEVVAGTSTAPTVNHAPVITDITNQSVEAGYSLNVPVTATDPDNNPITYSTVNLPSFATLTQSGGNVSLSIAPTISDAGTYNNVKVIVKDTYGAADTTTFNITVTQPPNTSGSYKLLLNFKLNNTVPAPWNNITGATSNLKNDQGQTTTVGLRFDETWWAAGVEGATTGNNSGVYPDAVLAEYLYFGSLSGFFTGAPVMHGHLTGLSANTTYTIKFLSNSKWWAPQPDNGSTQFTINGVSKTLSAQNNTSTTADFLNLTADANGEIAFTLSIPPGGQVGYLNAMEIIATTNIQNLGNNTQLMGTGSSMSVTTNIAKSSMLVNVYPNPYIDNLAIDMTLQKTAPVMLIEINDLSGKRLYSETRKEVPQGKNLIRINTQRTVVLPGVYILKITSSTGETKSVKLIRQN